MSRTTQNHKRRQIGGPETNGEKRMRHANAPQPAGMYLFWCASLAHCLSKRTQRASLQTAADRTSPYKRLANTKHKIWYACAIPHISCENTFARCRLQKRSEWQHLCIEYGMFLRVVFRDGFACLQIGAAMRTNAIWTTLKRIVFVRAQESVFMCHLRILINYVHFVCFVMIS